ncbi:hypothetical protein FHS76_002638 [Ochrobactrum daejeonense]|uniref:Lectin-like protein BA14k n=1 Tax=Brucella daejeonensis TaxID=659015 RepID=A0A7W9ELV7_9HYPH|nr:BA14K family protein [Brucella daejeonensis]MBB5702749.1 hypothetical protein [Brucella daejeonensis]
MNTFKKMMVGLVGASFLIGAMVPVSAAPIVPDAPTATNENIQNVRDRHRGSRHWGGYRPGPRPGWGHRPYRHRPGYWNGHRGYRYYRPGYRRYNDGWWYPLAAFGAGAIVGGALAAPARPVYRAPAYSNAHVQWCYNRYRSYRASDNTFQPYNGPRQQCYSPY